MSGSTWFGSLFFGLILALLVTQVLLQLRHRLDELILLIVAAFMACIHWRFVILFTIALSPVLASMLARWAPAIGRSHHRVFLEIVALALVGFGAATLTPSESRLQQLVDREFPAAGVRYLRTYRLGSRVLNQYSWGGYLIWRFRGQQKVFIDGRSDLYEYGGVLSRLCRTDSRST